jgi:hypothetical protein
VDPLPAGSTEAGNPCAWDSDCRREDGEVALCREGTEADVQQKVQRCHRLFRGQAGTACAVTVARTGAPQLLGGLPLPFNATSAYCALADDLECDLFAHVCVVVPKLGEGCSGRLTCAHGSFCDQERCVAQRPLGARCISINDFLDQPECVPGSHCDIASDTCVPAQSEGAQCDYGPACVSGACVSGRCAPEGTCPG